MEQVITAKRLPVLQPPSQSQTSTHIMSQVMDDVNTTAPSLQLGQSYNDDESPENKHHDNPNDGQQDIHNGFPYY
jgi:hypothetical protein